MPVRKPKHKAEEIVVEEIKEEVKPTKKAKKPVAKAQVEDKVTVRNAKGDVLQVSSAYYDKYKERLERV